MLFTLAVGIGICSFMLLQLGQKREHMGQAKLLAVAIQLLWIIRFGLFYVKLVDLEGVTAPMVIYDQVILFLDGPLIWLYTRSLIEPRPIKPKIWVHFLPFLIMFCYTTYQLITSPEAIVGVYQDTWLAFQEGGSTASPVSMVIISGILLFNLLYMWRSVKVARAYNKALEEEYSTTDRMTADWIIQFQKLWAILFVIPLLLYFINYIWPIFNMLTLAGTALVAIVLLSIIFNNGLLKQVYVPIGRFKKNDSPNKKPTAVKELKKELESLYSLLQKEQLYLEESLTLSDLAEAYQVKPTELTELIKTSEYDNFYDLINSFRIEEVKTQLLSSDEQVIQIAYQCGFRSKSTFNKIFKEKTDLTPKAFRNSH